MANDLSGGLQSRPDLQAKVMRKVALRLIPFLAVAYFLNYIDRSNIGVAKLTMAEDIGLTETTFGIASAVFFIGYVFCEVPSNLALYRFGARKWIARIMVSWGAVVVGMAFIQDATGLYIARFLLGIAEAGFFPGVILFLTWWFPRAMRVRLTALFMLALPISQAIGNPLSAAVLQYLDGIFGLTGWQALFIVQGVPTVAMGVAAWFYLTDRPRQAKWLTPEERDWLDSSMSVELAETPNVHGSTRESLRDPRVWALGGVYFTLSYSLIVLSFFLPTIVAQISKNYSSGLSVFQTGLVSGAPFAVGAVAMFLWARHADRSRERLWHVVGPLALAGVATPIALFMDSPVAIMAVFCIAAIGIFGAYPAFWYLPSSFLTGSGAAAGIALVNTLGATAGLVGPYLTGWLLDATGSPRIPMSIIGGLLLLGALLLILVFKSMAKTPEMKGTTLD
jgi:MFS transporter, ACS family, tartrate transporter